MQIIEKWLESHGLNHFIEDKIHVFEKILDECLNYSGEHVLIMGDLGTQEACISGVLIQGYSHALRKKKRRI